MIPRVGKPVIKFNGMGIRSVLVLINPRAGYRQALNYFTVTLQHQLDKEGVVYKVRQSPPDDMTAVLRTERSEEWEAVVLVGGDGTFNAYVNHAHAPEAHAKWGEKPILIIPTGMLNGIATSTGHGSPEATVPALRYGKILKLPLWEASLDGIPVALVAASVSVGYFADMIFDGHQLRMKAQESHAMMLPRRRHLWASLYNTFYRFRSLHANVDLYADDKALDPTTSIRGPLRTVVASQMPQVFPGYSLTPTAALGEDGNLHVTVATSAASRLRMLHLVHREGPARGILEEDGVSTHTARKVVIDFYDDAPVEDKEHAEALKKDPWDPRLIRPPTRLGLFDGEVYPIPVAAPLVIKPSPLYAPLIVP